MRLPHCRIRASNVPERHTDGRCAETTVNISCFNEEGSVLTTSPDIDEAGSQALADAHSQLAEAIAFHGYDEGTHAMLKASRRELTVSIPLRRDDGTVEVLTGYRIQHNISRGPAKGGLRFSASVNV